MNEFEFPVDCCFTEGQGRKPCFERVPAPGQFPPPKAISPPPPKKKKIVSLRFQTAQHKSKKIHDSSRTPSKRAGARKGQSAGRFVAGTYRSTDFLRGLAPGRLNRFSIGRYEKNREFFTFLLQSLKAERCNFFLGGGGGGNRPGAGTVLKQGFLSCPHITSIPKW